MTMEKASGNPLEQFVLLSKTTKGAAAAELIKQALESPGVYVFGELLDMPNIVELKNGPYANYYHLLHLFAYGTCSEYRANKSQLPLLSSVQMTKLRHLTIVSLATKNKCLPYTLLLKELEVSNLRELEDLIIEVIYADIIRGKLDQKHQHLEVDYAIGRDIKSEQIGDIISVLQEWCFGCEALLENIEQQVKTANDQKDTHTKLLQKIELEVANIKKTLKTTHQQDLEEQMSVDLPSTTDKVGKKSSKTKGGSRGAASGSTTKSSK